MTTLTLLAKAHNKRQLKQIEHILSVLFEGLDAKYELIGTTETDWIQIAVIGEDEVVASKYVAKNIGLSPVNIAKARKFTENKGFIESQQCNDEEILIDIGVFQPKILYGRISLRSLQMQLVDGTEVGLAKIVELFALRKNVPLGFKILDAEDRGNVIEGELSVSQLRKFRIWRDSLLDRLIVVGVPLEEVRKALKQLMFYKDVIDIESLGVLEHSLICKLDTDAVGLIPGIGKILKRATFAIFSPRKITNFLET